MMAYLSGFGTCDVPKQLFEPPGDADGQYDWAQARIAFISDPMPRMFIARVRM